MPDPYAPALPMPALVAGAFARAGLAVRARMLARLLSPLGPLALAALAGGAFAKYLQRSHWTELTVTLDDAATATAQQVYELATYIEQSHPHLVVQLWAFLPRDAASLATLAASVAAIAWGTLAQKRASPPKP